MCVDKESVDKVCVDKECVDKVCVDKVCVDKECVDKVCVDKGCVDKVCVDKVCVEEGGREEEAEAAEEAAAGYRNKNKNPTQSCGEHTVPTAAATLHREHGSGKMHCSQRSAGDRWSTFTLFAATQSRYFLFFQHFGAQVC